MVKANVKLAVPGGLHLRPAEKVCRTAMQYQSHIEFQLRDAVYNAKSVLSVLGACIREGDEFVVLCEGPDEAGALAAMVQVITVVEDQ